MIAPKVIRKSASEELRLGLEEYRGHQLLNLRVWFQDSDGQKRPGRQGLAVRVELLPQFREAILEIEAEARRLGLIKGGI